MDSNEKGKSAERYIANLAKDIFIGYWCYPNPRDEQGNKKEICDLLVLFKNVCMICEIKNYAFQNDFSRYFKRTLDKAAAQIAGAERKLFHSSNDIFIKHDIRGIVRFERERFNTIIRIIVHTENDLPLTHMGRVSSGSSLIHFLTLSDFEHMLRELVSMVDISNYLHFRAKFVTELEVTIYGRDKDLLGLYLKYGDGLSKYIDDHKGERLLFDLDNYWINYERSKRASSPFEDDLLEVEGLLYMMVNTDLILRPESRMVAEELMSLSRHERRLFAVSFLEFMDTYLHKGYTRIIRRHAIHAGIGIVFFYYPSDMDDQQVMQFTMLAAEGYAHHLNYSTTNMIVIALSESTKFKITHMDCATLRNVDQEQLVTLLNMMGWFQQENMQTFTISFNKVQQDK